jgi:DNA-binding beta-propeller fold protein YncE
MGDCNCGNNTTPGGICVECDVPQFARNNYFTGKLLVERDFTDEQRYYLGKLRRHNQRLHGWGAVCGLVVEEHPNPACQTQYVLIEPGTAVDCCGREIVVQHEEYFDYEQKFLSNWQTQNGPTSTPDTAEHTIQVCISYNECTQENVPSVFDDCGGGGGACRPNRIVDGYSFDVIIDPKEQGNQFAGVFLKWDGTINLASPVALALNDATNRLYVLTNPASGAVVYAVDTTNGSIVTSQSFDQDVALDVAVSFAGDFVYVAFQPPTPTAQPQPDPQIAVLSSDFSTTVSTLTVTGGAGQPVRMAVVPAPDDRLLAVNHAAGALIWAPDVTTSSTPAAPTSITVGTTPSDVVVSSSGAYAYVANTGTGNVTAVTLSSLAVTTLAVGTGSAVPALLAVANTTAGDTLAVLDTTNDTLYVIGMRPDPSIATALGSPVTGFASPAVGVSIAAGGQWVYVIEQDSTGKGWVQAVNEHAVELGLTPVLGAAVAAGVDPTGGAALSADGTTLYLPYTGNSSVSGAVAIVGVTPNDCSSIFDQALNPCPDCSAGNCIVLATITGYVYQSAVTTSMIDNLTDRRLLVSTDLLAEAVKCLMAQGPASGSAGTQGPPGPAGLPGTNGTDGMNGTNGINGTDGAPGAGLDTGLTRITALSWTHGQPGNAIAVEGSQYGTSAVAIEFANPIDTTQIDAVNVFQVWVSVQPPATLAAYGIQWIQLLGETVPVTNQITGNLITGATLVTGTTTVTGVAFIATNPPPNIVHVRIRFLGDFVIDSTQRAVCAEFVRAQFPTGEIPAGSDYGLQGGTFESWFTPIPGK